MSVVTVEIAGHRYPIRSDLDERYIPKRAARSRVVHASVPRKPEARLITVAPPAFAGSFDLPTRQSGHPTLPPTAGCWQRAAGSRGPLRLLPAAAASS